METYRFTLTGATPLIYDADDVDKAELLERWRKDPANKNISKPGDDRCPPWGWKRCVYLFDGFVAMPSDNLMPCLRKAGTEFKAKGQRTYKAETQTGIVFAEDGYTLLVGDKPIPAAAIEAIEGDFDDQCEQFAALCGGAKIGKLDVRRARPQTQKHVRVRPMFYQWGVTGLMHVIEPALNQKLLTDIFQFAGNKVGVGNWRPSAPKAPGPYGRFTVKISQEV